MTTLNDKFGVYAKQIENSIEQTPKASGKATLRGKFNRLTTADVLLRSAFLTDILEPVKILSLVSQKECSDIIATTDSVKRCKEKYQRWHKKFNSAPEKVFDLPILKSILSKIDMENHIHQGIKLSILIARSSIFRIGLPR